MADDAYQLMQQLQQQNKLQRQKYGSIEPYTNPKMKRVKNIADMLQAFGLARTPRDAFRMANKMNAARDTVGEFLPGTSYELAKERNDKLGQGLAMIDLIPGGGLLTAPVKVAKKAKGTRLLDEKSKDLLEEFSLSGGAKIDNVGNVTLYHRTNKQAADKIKETGEMIGKEDRLYFSTKPDGAIKGYGEELVEVKIPINKLDLEDVFSDEIHVTLSSNFKPQQIQVVQKR